MCSRGGRERGRERAEADGAEQSPSETEREAIEHERRASLIDGPERAGHDEDHQEIAAEQQRTNPQERERGDRRVAVEAQCIAPLGDSGGGASIPSPSDASATSVPTSSATDASKRDQRIVQSTSDSEPSARTAKRAVQSPRSSARTSTAPMTVVTGSAVASTPATGQRSKT